MNKLVTTKNLTIANLIIVSYFGIIYILNYYKIDFVLIGVFSELLTIPFLIAQLVFLGIGIKHLFKNKKEVLNIISLLLLATSSFITLRSFF
ncbi:hypothetical protein [uncultured Flavobacterium sp.]|uniref:hypothetical protein n=1 Tax=uncultured Flavobacterium sp. TaxID=165435 RepID=UPI0030ED038A